MTPFWTSPRPLVLASGSEARLALLEAALVPLVVVPASIDERMIEEPLRSTGASPAAIAEHLAAAKAFAVSAVRPDDLVLGADQTLALGGRLFTKPETLTEARSVLETLAGHTHSLHAAWALVRNGQRLAGGSSEAHLTMRNLGADFLEKYIAAEGVALCSSVGAYRLEGLGIQLFDSIQGDQSTILGLPLLPVLAALRRHGYLIG